jgi:hypothetical protein
MPTGIYTIKYLELQMSFCVKFHKSILTIYFTSSGSDMVGIMSHNLLMVTSLIPASRFGRQDKYQMKSPCWSMVPQ